ncbi:hypothetical protein O0L34_g13424 [Tuta absoluta]|nr:hypothetical protein O0L34_g13424 [Tuta absoluta]
MQGDAEIENVINIIMQNTRETVNMIASTNNTTNTIVTSGHCLIKPVSIIYTSEHDVTPSFAIPSGSSTPKKKKEVSKLSPEEKAYFDDISAVLREWVQNKPAHFKNLDDSNMNEVMILDLAGELVDQAKLGQLVKTADKETIITHYILKWVMKFEIVDRDDLKQAAPYATVLLKKLLALPVPVLTKPHHGTRQTIKNLKHQENTDFVPEAQDILEDEISIWMNEYPSHIYANPDKSVQNKLVHEFAEKLKHKNKSDKDYGKEINGWLKTVLKPGEKDRIDSMSTSLTERITKLPTDETIAANEEIKAQYQKQKQMHKDSPDISQNMTVENDNDNTLKEFIVKYVEHSSDEDDPLAKAAYVKLLTSELKRLSPTILEELREGQPLEKFAPQRLFKELQYIKDISDWLKTLPIDPKYNQVGNRNRIEFIINLAKDINQIEQERLQNPDAMNFDEMIMSTICMNMQTIPHRFQHGTRINEYVHPLIVQIFLKREEIMPLIPDNQLWGNIADFLDDYIRLNGNDIVDDEAKVEVWAARLLEEIKKMIAENPYSLPRADLNDRLAGVAKPGDETVKRFEHELDYAKEISDWLHNFPLIDSVDDEMIRDLAEKMAESEKDNDENNLVKYIEQWILKLPLDISKQIDVPFVTQQLLNRKNKILEDKDAKMFTLSQPKIINTSSKVVREQKESAKALCRGCCPVDDPGTIIVQVINEWCDKLPLVGANDVIKNTKTNIANKLYQKDMEINDNPRLARNDILYMESLLEIIDELLENLPPKVNIEGNTQELKTKLFDDLRQAKIFIKEVSLGDEYIRDLEDAVDLAVPNTSGGKSGAFEVYKENIVEKFILDNFDHGTDAISQKYKSKLQNEIDKYAYSVQQRLGTAIPIEKLNNEIMSVLFDVKMPFENALQDNVEEIKTKCEVDDWVQKLPIRPVTGPADALNIDQKMRLLARKVHILEFKENPEEIILKEIRKWLTKAPLKREQEPNIYKYADDLQEMLNKSRKNRKCVPSSVVAEAVLEPIDEDNSIWINPNITTDQKNSQDPPKHKTSDILLGLVEQWSNNIPFPSNVVSQNEIDAIKDDITVQIIKKISELNSSPSTFDDDRLYNHLMNEEIEKALARVPQNDTLIQSKGALKYQLTSAIESVKPLIREERARHEYKTELDATVKKILGATENPTAAEKNMLEKVNEEIVDDFLEYQYNKNDNDGKEFYKNKMVKSLTQYNIIGEKDENKNEIISDTLVETNRLLCELQKVNAPMNLSLKDEVEEIRMKHEVNNFLDKVSPAPTNAASARRTSIRDSLAKQLHELEKTGHTDDNNKKMAAAVSRTLKRLNVEDKMDQIEPFIERLHKNEPIRKAPPYSPLALKELRMGSPPRDQTIEDHGGHLRVEASVYQPDYVPPNWVPPKPPLSSSLEQIFFIPHESLPPRSEPTGSTQQRLSQPTQTPAVDSTGTVPDQPRQRPTRARAKHAGVQSGPGLASREDGHTSDEDCLCALCKKYPCEFPFDYYDDCDCSLPMFRRPMMYPRCPPMMMPPCMPSPYMF